MAVGMQWVTVVTATSAEMVVPGLLGYWLDQWLGTKVLFLLLGFAGGTTLAMWRLVKLTSSKKTSGAKTDSSPDQKPPPDRPVS